MLHLEHSLYIHVISGRRGWQPSGWVLTRTVVSVRSSSWRLTLTTDPPIKVVVRVLRKPAGLFPLVFAHVEIAGAQQADYVLYGREEGEKGPGPGLFFCHNKTDSLPIRKKPIPHFYSPQSISSDSSAQSALLSHTRWDSMQSPLPHTKSVTAGQLTVSTTSKTHTDKQELI